MDIREICRLAGPDVDAEALARELMGSEPMSEEAVKHVAAWMVWENIAVVEGVFASENTNPNLEEIYRRMARSLRGLSGWEIALRFSRAEGRRGFLSHAARWAARDQRRREGKRRRRELLSTDLAAPGDGRAEADILGELAPVQEEHDPSAMSLEGRAIRTLAFLWAAADLMPDFVSAQGKTHLPERIALVEMDLRAVEEGGRLPSFKDVQAALGFGETHGRLVQLRRWYRGKMGFALAVLGEDVPGFSAA